MSSFTFTKAVKQQEKLRMAIDGPSGGGKTWTSLTIGTVLADAAGGRIALIDSERGSAKKYASDFDFDHLSLPDSNPHTYIGAIRAADEAGYSVVIVDSLSHAWEGTLELKDEVAKRSRNDSFGAWREVTPIHNELVDTLLRADAHVIVTMRTKTAYAIEEYETEGRTRTRVQKLGLKPIQRDGVEYEFDVVGDMDVENTLVVSKTRCSALAGAVIRKPGVHLAKTLLAWLDDGQAVISGEDADRLKAELNARTGDVRAAWLEQFGCKPPALPADRLAEADTFIAEHPIEPDDPTPPGGGGGGAAPSEDADQHTGADGEGDGAAGSGEPAVPAPDERDQAVNARDVAKYAATVLRPAFDAAPPRQGTRHVERLRHALIYGLTDGRATSLNDLEPAELITVQTWLRHIEKGLVTYATDDEGVTFVLLATGVETEVLWSQLEQRSAAGAAA